MKHDLHRGCPLTESQRAICVSLVSVNNNHVGNLRKATAWLCQLHSGLPPSSLELRVQGSRPGTMAIIAELCSRCAAQPIGSSHTTCCTVRPYGLFPNVRGVSRVAGHGHQQRAALLGAAHTDLLAVPRRAALPKSALGPAHKHTGAFMDNTLNIALGACVGVSRAADWGTNSKLRSLERCSLPP